VRAGVLTTYALPDPTFRKVRAVVFSTLALFSLMELLAHPAIPVNAPPNLDANFNKHGDCERDSIFALP